MKIGVIGAGNVGASVAYALAMRQVCEQIALVDIFGDVARAKAIDISQATCVFGGTPSVCGGDNYELLAKANIVIITAGSPRKDGQTREDLLLKNAHVVRDSAQKIAKVAPNAIIIVVTNPLDVMTWVARKESGFENSRVLGMAGELDSARCRYELANFSKQPAHTLSAKVIGAHNDKMIVAQENLSLNLSPSELEDVANQTKNGGAKIVKLLGTSAYYAPAAAAVKMCEAIKNNSDEPLSVCVNLDKKLACGRLVRLGNNGIREILEPNLNQTAAKELSLSEAQITKSIEFLEENLT